MAGPVSSTVVATYSDGGRLQVDTFAPIAPNPYSVHPDGRPQGFQIMRWRGQQLAHESIYLEPDDLHALAEFFFSRLSDGAPGALLGAVGEGQIPNVYTAISPLGLGG